MMHYSFLLSVFSLTIDEEDESEEREESDEEVALGVKRPRQDPEEKRDAG